jgi:glycosyltransferase involved in cell wall biosynthesis
MEILFVTHKYPPSTGGMEKQSYELIEGMRSHARVHAIVPRAGQSKLLFFAALRRQILDTCRANPGITHVHFNDALLAAVCLRHRGYEHLRRIVTLHGLDVVFPNRLYQQRILPAFNRFDLIVAVSTATAEACIRRGIDPGKVVVIPNGVDHSIAEQAEKARQQSQPALMPQGTYLMALGRAVQRKGFSWFIREVLPKLPPETQLLLVGPFAATPTRAERLLNLLPAGLRRQITLALGFPTDEALLRTLLSNHPQVCHLGRLPWPDVVSLLSHARAFVMPNIPVEGDMEGFGLVCLEACLCGTPVFASRLEGITEAIHDGQNGRLLPSGDAMAWVAALTAVFDGSASPAPTAYVEYTLAHFGWEKMVLGYRDAFALQ